MILIDGRYTGEALRLLRRAIRSLPKTAKNPNSYLRYNAACCAILHAAGRGRQVPPPGDRPSLRREAFEWLQSDLRAWPAEPAEDPAGGRETAHRWMRHWLADPDLADVRHPLPLAFLPADERAKWQKLWTQVRALRDATAPEVAPPPRLVR